MIGLVPPDRWTCPSCHVTEVPNVRDADALRRAIHRAQRRHADDHRRVQAAAKEARRG